MVLTAGFGAGMVTIPGIVNKTGRQTGSKVETAMAEIRLDGVRKEYPNGFQAVKTFDLHIRDGEFVVFVR